MIWPFRQKAAQGPDTQPLYEAVVAATRQPALYQAGQVPDTFEGRFELLILHAALVLRRVAELPDSAAVAQSFADTLFTQLDQTLREMGVSDIGVPKRMKRLAEAYRGRSAAYETALADKAGTVLPATLARNVLGRETADGAAQALARYTRQASQDLGTRTLDDILAGRHLFPDADALLNRGPS